VFVTGFAICFGLLSSKHEKAEIERTTFEELRGFDIFIERVDKDSGHFEKWLGFTIEQHQYRARLGYQQNHHLFKLTKLEYLAEPEWYAPKNFDGVQSLKNLQRLEIYDIESPDEVDLTALEDHPTLEIVLIGGETLDAATNFQEWESSP